MKLKNTSQRYGLVSVALHWLMALLILSLYFLGLYIVDLTYYDPEYKTIPAIHKGLGLLMFALLAFRLVWTALNTSPASVPGTKPVENQLAKAVHIAMYLLMLIIPISGYLISTADGRPVSFFGLFDVPALITSIDQQEEVAGRVHEWSANLLIGLVVLHALAAVKHHFINRDQTLARMLGRSMEKTV